MRFIPERVSLDERVWVIVLSGSGHPEDARLALQGGFRTREEAALFARAFYSDQNPLIAQLEPLPRKPEHLRRD